MLLLITVCCMHSMCSIIIICHNGHSRVCMLRDGGIGGGGGGGGGGVRVYKC